jgi:hypothetical protein
MARRYASVQLKLRANTNAAAKKGDNQHGKIPRSRSKEVQERIRVPQMQNKEKGTSVRSPRGQDTMQELRH